MAVGMDEISQQLANIFITKLAANTAVAKLHLGAGLALNQEWVNGDITKVIDHHTNGIATARAQDVV
jgi:hypothetical protein